MSRRWWVGVAALACVVAGCGGGEGDPGGSSTPSVTVSESPTAPSTTGAAGAVAPTLPPEAAGEDAAAAEAFVRFYWEMADYAQATGDVSGLRALGADGCEACAAGVEFVEEVHGDGGTITGGETTLANVKATKIRVANRPAFQVRLDVTTTDQEVDRRPGTKKDEFFPGGTLEANFVVKPSGTGWLVEFWEVA